MVRLVQRHGQLDPGNWAERRALRLLRHRGWSCLAERWSCRYGELDLLMLKSDQNGLRLLVVEVKARRRCGLDRWGISAFDARKRQRMARTLSCWRAGHPWCADASVEVVLALVPLPPSSGHVRWIRVAQLVDAVDHHEFTRFPG